MHRILLAALLLLAAAPAFATQPAQSCREACRVQASRPGATPAAAQACFIRCGGGLATAMAREEPRARPQPFIGVGRPVRDPAMVQGSHGVIFAARTPSAAYGMAVGGDDRLASYRLAEQRCAAGGPGCRMIAEFTQACGAVAHGLRRAQGAFVMTSDPSTYTVTSVSGGSGASQAAAEAGALAECRSRDPQGICRVAAARCGSRS